MMFSISFRWYLDGTSATKSRSAIKPFVFAAAALGAAAGAYALYNMKKDEEKSKNTCT